MTWPWRLVSRNTGEDIEKVLTNDVTVMREYYRKWRPTPNQNKTQCVCFHLNNKKTTPQLNIRHPESHNLTPAYLGVTLDRSLTQHLHLQKTTAKMRRKEIISFRDCMAQCGDQQLAILKDLCLQCCRVLLKRLAQQSIH